jgi:hypothetical protein
MTAQSSVLGMPELLEAVLLCLDMQSLLTQAKRVCRSWHELINRSVQIQQALFYKPEPTPPTTHGVDTRAPLNMRQNPLFRQFFQPWFVDWIKHGDKTWQSTDLDALDLFKQSAVYKNRDAFLRKGASWRTMLVTQPPLPAIGIFESKVGDFGTSYKSNVRKFLGNDNGEIGLRMGDFYDMIYHHTSASYGPFTFRVLWLKPKDVDAMEKQISSLMSALRDLQEQIDPGFSFSEGRTNDPIAIIKLCRSVSVVIRVDFFSVCTPGNPPRNRAAEFQELFAFPGTEI